MLLMPLAKCVTRPPDYGSLELRKRSLKKSGLDWPWLLAVTITMPYRFCSMLLTRSAIDAGSFFRNVASVPGFSLYMELPSLLQNVS